MAAAQYDGIASAYQRTRDSALRLAVEVPSFLGLVGPVAGLRVLDLACGDGFYTRRLRTAGAEVCGVDISPAMIGLAQAEERARPLGIRYHCADAAELPGLGRFDLVTGAYLLHYAADAGRLRRICRAVAGALVPGGRFVALNENPAQPAELAGEYAGYGFSKSLEGPLADGTPIAYRMIAGREVFGFRVYWYARATYEGALREAGFRQISWLPLRLDTDAAGPVPPGYFAAYLASPPVLLLDCRL